MHRAGINHPGRLAQTSALPTLSIKPPGLVVDWNSICGLSASFPQFAGWGPVGGYLVNPFTVSYSFYTRAKGCEVLQRRQLELEWIWRVYTH